MYIYSTSRSQGKQAGVVSLERGKNGCFGYACIAKYFNKMTKKIDEFTN